MPIREAREREWQLRYLDLATRRTTILAPLPKIYNPSTRSISLSPDGRNLIWGQIDPSNTDLMLIENFR